jgi:hypothetical protein
MTSRAPVELELASRPNHSWFATTWVARAIGRRGVFLWPVFAAVLIGGVGLVVDDAVESEIRRSVERHVGDVLEAHASAVEFWYGRRLDAVAGLASSADVRGPAAVLLGSPAGDARARALADYGDALHAYVAAQQVFDALLIAPDRRVVAATDERALSAVLEEEAASEALQAVFAGGAPVASRPYRTLLPFVADGRRQAGLPVILMVAPLRGDDGAVTGALAVVHRAKALTSLLQPGEDDRGGPTYALDPSGLFVTRSPYEATLERVGLLGADASSILTLQARDPGVDMTAGARSELRRSEQPLTRAAEGAAARQGGQHSEGYRDYRGVRVIGAWRWLPTAQLGLVTELDVADAYAPLAIIRRVTAGLLALLALAAVLIFAFTLLVRRTSRRAGQYDILEKLGQGAMGTVYRARHQLLRRPTAVKVLEQASMSREAFQRFEREAQATSALRHPNTVTVYDYGRTSDGAFYYAMELLDGITLDDLVSRHGPVSEPRAVHLLTQIAGALAEAHAAGLVHRDVKPANIMVTNRAGAWDFVKVLDFGLVTAGEGEVRVTQVHQVMGTPLYMAPESLGGVDRIGPPADVHAVGAIGYFLLTGTTPFDGATATEVLTKIAAKRPEPPSARLGSPITPALEELLLRCLAKRPHDRPADGQALVGELEKVLTQVGPWRQEDARAWWHVRTVDARADTVVVPAPGTGGAPADGGAAARGLTATSQLPVAGARPDVEPPLPTP